jgi:predicted nucleotidyltransferase
VTFLRVLEQLNAHDVRYVVVGGLAVVLHGHPRMTQDVDIAVDWSKDNIERLVAAAEALELVPRAPVPLQALLDPAQREKWQREKHLIAFSLWNPAQPLLVLDVLLALPIPWEELQSARESFSLAGITVPVCSREHLLAMKRAAGRAQDISDIEELNGSP